MAPLDNSEPQDQAERVLASAAALPLFAGLPPDLLQRILGGAQLVRASVGTVLFNEGDPPTFVHLLISGLVDISKKRGRRSCAAMIFTAGDVFMPEAALFHEPYLASARVLVPARLLLLEGSRLREEAEMCPRLAMRLCRLASGHWRMAMRHILDLQCRSGAQRLAALLLRLVGESPWTDEARLPFPKHQLAARAAITPETLSRTLQLLAENGLHLRGSRILVKDRPKIERFCGPDPYPDRSEECLGVFAI